MNKFRLKTLPLSRPTHLEKTSATRTKQKTINGGFLKRQKNTKKSIFGGRGKKTGGDPVPGFSAIFPIGKVAKKGQKSAVFEGSKKSIFRPILGQFWVVFGPALSIW